MKKFIIAVSLVAILNIVGGCSITNHIPKWDECSKSSNWHGPNANWRMMNMLSPHMPDNIFAERMAFMKSRGCNTAHLILCNKADGEFAGYSIYGTSDITWTIDKSVTDKMTKRIKTLRNNGFGIVLWLITDDSALWARKLAANPQKYIADIDSLGWFKQTSTVCIGLELDEYYTANVVNSFAVALKSKYNGKIATHHTSGHAQFASLGDLLFWQVEPTSDKNKIVAVCSKARSFGKPVNMFETWREENRETSEVALANGCYAVGNW